jgi:hypothetical protein
VSLHARVEKCHLGTLQSRIGQRCYPVNLGVISAGPPLLVRVAGDAPEDVRIRVLIRACRTSSVGEQARWGEPAQGAHLAGQVRLIGVAGIG